MNINQNIIEYAHEIFIQLLKQAENADETNIFGLNAIRTNEFELAAKTSTQLIEICSWLELMNVLRPKLKEIVEVLERSSVKDKNLSNVHPSRIKAILLFGEYDLKRIISIMKVICDDKYLYTREFLSIKHLSYVDLLGTYIHLTKDKQKQIGFMDRITQKKINEIYNEQINKILEAIMDSTLLKKVGISEVSFMMRLLIANRNTDVKVVKQRILNICSELADDIKIILNDSNINKYESWSFSKLSYAFTVLFWCERVWGIKCCESIDANMWLKSCYEHLLQSRNPYHKALFIKPILAEQKVNFINLHSQMGVSALIELQNYNDRMDEITLKEDIIEAFSSSISIEVENVRRLTAGWSKASVFKARGKFTLPTIDKEGDISKEYVIKLGQHSDIVKASKIYSILPTEAKALFVRHQTNPSYGTIGRQNLHYILMEQLVTYKEVNNYIKDYMPKDETTKSNKKGIENIIKTALQLISKLHTIKVDEIPIFKKDKQWKIKIAELYHYQSKIANKDPILSEIVTQGCNLKIEENEVRLFKAYKIIGGLITFPNILMKVEKEYKVEDRFVLVHGDCHGNNIMIKEKSKDSIFIDIADCHIDDYLEDYVQLTAHLCFSSNLEKMSENDILKRIKSYPESKEAESLDNLFIEKASSLKLIWDLIVQEVQAEAKSIGDINVMTRFCILLGSRLLFISSKSKSIIVSYILYLFGMQILQQIYENMKQRGRIKDDKILIYLGEWNHISLM